MTALAVMDDHAAVGVIAAVAEHGWRIPRDLTLMLVLSSARVAEMFHPRLTTLEPPSAELGRLGAGMLIDRLTGDGEGHPGSAWWPAAWCQATAPHPPPADGTGGRR